MKFRIYFTHENIEDYFIVEGETIEKIKKLAESKIFLMGLNVERNNVYSMQVSD